MPNCNLEGFQPAIKKKKKDDMFVDESVLKCISILIDLVCEG